jgi:hypothetical protein
VFAPTAAALVITKPVPGVIATERMPATGGGWSHVATTTAFAVSNVCATATVASVDNIVAIPDCAGDVMFSIADAVAGAMTATASPLLAVRLAAETFEAITLEARTAAP